MFKIGDIVEITDESDATGMLDFVKGKGYPVIESSREASSGGYETIYIEQVKLKDESGRVSWYGSGLFKLKEKEGKKVETLFKEGQVVWDVVYGKGVVVDILENHSYPIVVEFDEGVVSYTNDGRTCKTHGRTLFFSEPKIEAATEPVFEPVLKEMQPIILTRQGVEVQMVAGWVNKETPTEIDLMTTTDTTAIYKKNEWKAFSVGDRIIFN